MFMTYHSRFLDRDFTFETGSITKLKKKYKLENIEDANGLTFIDPAMTVHIWMPSFSATSPADISVLSHEIVHAACYGLDYAQIPLFQKTDDGDLNTEALAYLVGELTEAFLSKVPKAKSKAVKQRRAKKDYHQT